MDSMMNKTGDRMANESISSMASDGASLAWIALTRDIFLTLRLAFVWVSSATGIVGIIGNVLTILVFARLGFSETIHMSYVALAVTDLGSVLTIIWVNICNSPILGLFVRLYGPTDPAHFMNFTGGWPHMAFSRTTALITAWISFERCLCVVFPTKVKVMITRTVTKAVLVTIFVIGCGPVVFGYVGYRLEWRVNPQNNQTRLAFSLNGNNRLNPLNRFAFSLYGLVYPILSLGTVIVCTTFLVIKLKQSAAWRKRATTALSTGPGATTHDQRKTHRTTKTVIFVASVFIACSSPLSAHFFFASLNRDYSINGPLTYRYVFMANALLCVLLSEINSSVNVFVFAIMGSKFRSTLAQIFVKK